jgi:hypothetical protein
MDSKLGSGTEIPMDDVIRMMNKTGFAFSYEDFKDLYDKSPQLQALVGDHSERSVTVGQQEPDLGDGEPDSAEVVDQIASKAASAAINK